MRVTLNPKGGGQIDLFQKVIIMTVFKLCFIFYFYKNGKKLSVLIRSPLQLIGLTLGTLIYCHFCHEVKKRNVFYWLDDINISPKMFFEKKHMHCTTAFSLETFGIISERYMHMSIKKITFHTISCE